MKIRVIMKAKELIKTINDRLQSERDPKPNHDQLLTNSKLNDLRKHLNPKPTKKLGKSYYDFSENHKDILFTAWKFIAFDGIKTSLAFKRAKSTVDNPQVKLL